MTDIKNKPTQSPPPSDEAFVVNPIHMARARYASTHGDSALPQTRDLPPVALPEQNRSKATSSSRRHRLLWNSGPGNCMLLSLLSLVFLVGGILGGTVGGGLILWTGGAYRVAAAATSTPPLLPTPMPVILTPTPLIPTATPLPTPTPLATLSAEDIIASVIPSVVTIINRQQRGSTFNISDGRVVGSGVIIDNRGYIATNHHVIENTGSLSVIMVDGREMVGRLVASDQAKDLAVVKVDTANLPTIKWGNSSNLRLGQTVYAIGSPLGDFPNSVSFGIISGLNRALEMDKFVVDGLIQTDAAINRGSSGGPLVNAKGEMIGLNTFIIRESEDRGVAEGIAFAIPAEMAKNLLVSWIVADSNNPAPIPVSR